MKRHDDGSVTLTADESCALARVLDLSRELSTQLGAERQCATSETVEYTLLAVLDFVEELGVSSEELTGKLDLRRSGS